MCLAVAYELGALLSTERRGRALYGNKKGEDVPWTVSEARTIELLEKLCPLMTGYTLLTGRRGSGGKPMYAFKRHADHKDIPFSPGSAKMLQLHCEQIVEQQEEHLEELIKLGQGLGAGDMESLAFNLCIDTMGSCPDKETVLDLFPVTEQYKRVHEEAERNARKHAKGQKKREEEL
ncbi:hypothetical protein DIPPA_24676 [Diplonema papillatum]|nr:hypothetical protein DIPPA_24676 [Diplonema papillatum]